MKHILFLSVICIVACTQMQKPVSTKTAIGLDVKMPAAPQASMNAVAGSYLPLHFSVRLRSETSGFFWNARIAPPQELEVEVPTEPLEVRGLLIAVPLAAGETKESYCAKRGAESEFKTGFKELYVSQSSGRYVVDANSDSVPIAFPEFQVSKATPIGLRSNSANAVTAASAAATATTAATNPNADRLTESFTGFEIQDPCTNQPVVVDVAQRAALFLPASPNLNFTLVAPGTTSVPTGTAAGATTGAARAPIALNVVAGKLSFFSIDPNQRLLSPLPDSDDFDGDGISNATEAAAGTNPFMHGLFLQPLITTIEDKFFLDFSMNSPSYKFLCRIETVDADFKRCPLTAATAVAAGPTSVVTIRVYDAMGFKVMNSDSVLNISGSTANPTAVSNPSASAPVITAPAGISTNNLNSITFTMSGANVAHYKFKLYHGASTPPVCGLTEATYSSVWISTATPLTLTNVADFTSGDGNYRLCVIGKNAAGEVQSLPSVLPSEFVWARDTVAPTQGNVTFTTLPGSLNATSFGGVIVGGPGVVDYKFFMGASSSTCTLTASYTALTKQSIATQLGATSLIDGTTYHLCVMAFDAAGNASPGFSAGSWTVALPTMSTVSISISIPAINNMSTLTFTASATDLTEIQYVVIPSASTCFSATYGAWQSTLTVTNLSLPSDGALVLCVRGKNSSGSETPAGSAQVAAWTKDTSPPTPTLSGQPADNSSDTTLGVTVSGSGVAEYKYAFIDGATDCSSATYGSVIPIATPITDAIGGVGEKVLCVKGKDTAGNFSSTPFVYTWTRTTGGSVFSIAVDNPTLAVDFGHIGNYVLTLTNNTASPISNPIITGLATNWTVQPGSCPTSGSLSIGASCTWLLEFRYLEANASPSSTVTLGASGNSGAATTPSTVTVTATKQKLNISSVNPLNSNLTKWGQTIKRATLTDPVWSSAVRSTTTQCTGTETNRRSCIIAGEVKMAPLGNLPAMGTPSCVIGSVPLQAEDNFNAFMWDCFFDGSQLAFYAVGLRDDKRLADLIDFTVPQWKNMKLVVKLGGYDVAESSMTKWWSDVDLELLTANGAAAGPQTLANKIYLIGSSQNTAGYFLSAPGASIVVKPGIVLTYTGSNAKCDTGTGGIHASTGAHCLLHTNSSFHFIEGAMNANNTAAYGLLLYQSRFNRINFASVQRATVVGLKLMMDSSYNKIHRSKFVYAGQQGVSVNGSDGNIISQSAIYGNGAQGIFFSGAANFNTLTRSVIANNTSEGVMITSGNSNLLHMLTVANHSNALAGIDINGASQNNLVMQSILANQGTGFKTNIPGSGNLYVGKLAISNSVNYPLEWSHGTSSPVTQISKFLLPSSVLSTCYFTAISNFTNPSCGSSAHAPVAAATETTITDAIYGKRTTADTTNADWSASAEITYSPTANMMQFNSSYDHLMSVGRGGGVAFPNSLHSGNCTSGYCAIFDWRLKTSGLSLNDSLSAASSTYSGASNCPMTGTSAFSYINSISATTYILPNAAELLFDDVGNDNGVCETNERCLYQPHIGAYLGEGDFIQNANANGICNFAGGAVSGVTLFAYPVTTAP